LGCEIAADLEQRALSLMEKGDVSMSRMVAGTYENHIVHCVVCQRLASVERRKGESCE